MADRGYRRSDNNRRTSRYGYIDGNTVRKPQTRPVPERTKTERQPERRKKTSYRHRIRHSVIRRHHWKVSLQI